MGRRGPAPKVLALRVLEGDRKAKIAAASHSPVPEQAPPDPPAVFTDEQRVMWNHVVERLTVMGIAYRCDSQQLAAYVYAEWTVQECIRRLNETGLLVRGRDGQPKPNPLLRIEMRACARATALGREFGLTPSSRQRLLPRPPEAPST
jgi:P27 family predicted phage terminase small subunit